MKKVLAVLLLLLAIQAYSQSDHNGNPIFNSVNISEDTVANYLLSSNYYTLKNNIEDKNSSVYISNNPTLDDIEKAAINLLSDFFSIVKNHYVTNIVAVVNKPSRKFMVINPTTGKQKTFSCSLKGDITENRANEIIRNKYDNDAKIETGQLFFNHKVFTIIPETEIRQNIITLIADKKLSEFYGSEVRYNTNEELKDLIVKESAKGGKLDFFTEIEGHEYDGIQIKPGIFGTKLEAALYSWGQANYELGVNSVDNALDNWKAFKGREATSKEKENISSGFEKILDKLNIQYYGEKKKTKN